MLYHNIVGLSKLNRRLSDFFLEQVVEIIDVMDAHNMGNFIGGVVRGLQKNFCVINAQGDEVVMRGKPGVLFELLGKVVLAGIDQRRHLVQADILREILLEVAHQFLNISRDIILLDGKVRSFIEQIDEHFLNNMRNPELPVKRRGAVYFQDLFQISLKASVGLFVKLQVIQLLIFRRHVPGKRPVKVESPNLPVCLRAVVVGFGTVYENAVTFFQGVFFSFIFKVSGTGIGVQAKIGVVIPPAGIGIFFIMKDTKGLYIVQVPDGKLRDRRLAKDIGTSVYDKFGVGEVFPLVFFMLLIRVLADLPGSQRMLGYHMGHFNSVKHDIPSPVYSVSKKHSGEQVFMIIKQASMMFWRTLSFILQIK